MLKPILDFLAFPFLPFLVLGGLALLFLALGYAAARDIYRIATQELPTEEDRFASYMRERAEREKGAKS